MSKSTRIGQSLRRQPSFVHEQLVGPTRNITELAFGRERADRIHDPFGAMQDPYQRQLERQQESMQGEMAANNAAMQAWRDALALWGEPYSGGTISGGGGSGAMASPMVVTPQQRWNMGMPGLQNQGQASRQDIAGLFQQMRQSPAMGGFNPLMPRTVMPPPQVAQRPPLQGDGPPILGGGGGGMTSQQMAPPKMYPQSPQGQQFPQISPELWQRQNLGMWR